MSQNQTQISYMEKVDLEQGKEIIEQIKQKLEFATFPKVHDLEVLPAQFMKIPGLQQFRDAKYSFNKYKGKHKGRNFIMYVGKDIIIRYFDKSIELIIFSHSSRKFYRRVFHNYDEVPEVLIPSFRDLTAKAESVSPEYPDDIVRWFFGLYIDLDPGNVLRQGHLYAIKIKNIENVEIWSIEDVYKIGNHAWEEVSAKKITEDIYYINTDSDLSIGSKDHGVALLPRGEWILYHPFD